MKKNKLEQKLINYAIFDKSNIKLAPVAEILEDFDFEEIAMGWHTRVYKLKDNSWVFKEGRWDFSVEFLGDLRFPLPQWGADMIFKSMGHEYFPTEKGIIKDYEDYLKFAQYFGYFGDSSYGNIPGIDFVRTAQKFFRNSLIYKKSEVERHYGIELSENIFKVLESDIKYHNFLPKEYLLIGKSINPKNGDKITSYIFQEFIKGQSLRNVDVKNLDKTNKQKVALMIYLILIMNMEIKLLPDTRPRYAFFEAYDWLTKTDNIMINEKLGPKFIDTRWFWDSSANVIKRGFIIPDVMISISLNYINKFLEDV